MDNESILFLLIEHVDMLISLFLVPEFLGFPLVASFFFFSAAPAFQISKRASMGREFRLMNGDSVPGEGLEDPELTVPAARQIIAEQLKLQAKQVVLFDQGLLSDTDALPDGLIQIYIQEIKVSMEEFLDKARKKPADCSELLRLNVMANLSALPTDVGEWFPKLTHFFLTNNHISHCPESIGNLKKLTEFDFDGNQLADLPESFQQLTALQQLKLDRNQFQEIPEGILCLENLKELSMCSNQLSKLPGLQHLAALERLAMAKNQICSVWPGLDSLRNLKELTLAQNQLEMLPDVFNLPQLKHLDLSFNQLTMLPDSIVTATSLKELLVNHNRLSFLPHHIGNLSQLKDLNLNANVLRFLPESFAALVELQNVWLDKGQMMVLPESSRALLRVAATLYTSLEGEELPATVAKAAGVSPPRKKKNDDGNEKAERIRGIFQSFDLNGDGVIDPAELRFVLRSIRDVGSALSDEMIESVLQQMDANKDGLVNFEEFLSWLYAQRPSTEKQLLRRAVGILEAEGAPEEATSALEVERPQMGPPSLTRLSSRALAEEARDALKALKEEELEELHSHTDAKVRGLLEVLSLLLAGMVPGTASTGPLAGAESLMKQPRYFLSACDSVLTWIDEGKLPEQNVESARAVKNSLPWHFQPEVVAKSVESTAAICLCKWMVAVFAYFDAVENWEP
eukprot:s811_g10.t1